eukprot:m.134704 g.134704  ORF g.134704 m.134704 type:complete len:84 (+) comp20144_c0_seq1:700-951(+)
MVELYKEKGFREEEARSIITMMAQHKDFFIDHMMVQELGILPPDDDEPSPVKKGVVIFCSFLTFGLVPLLCEIACSERKKMRS